MRILFVVSCATFVGASLWGSAGAGTREEIITSIHSGGSPYLIAYEDPQGTSRLDPGLYVRDDEGRWQLAFEGKIDPAPLRGGLHVQLELGRITGQSESIGLLDGRLVVFNSHSRQSRKESYIELGGAKWTDLLEPFTGQTLKIPLIKSAHDVAIYQTLAEGYGSQRQVVIISVKHPSALGTGLTFGFVLEAHAVERGVMGLPYTPLLLDWDFRPAAELGKRFIPNTTSGGFVSQIVLDALSRERLGEAPPLQKWRRELREISKDGIMDADFYKSNRAEMVPHFDIGDGKLEIFRLPSLYVELAKMTASFVWDPLTKAVIALEGTSVPSLREFATTSRFLEVEPVFSGHGTLLATDVVLDNAMTLVRSKTDWPHLVMRVRADSDERLMTLKILPTDARFLKERPLAVDVVTQAGADKKLFFVSWKFASGELTSVYQVETSTHTASLIRQLSLSHRYFSAEEMSMRLALHGRVLGFDETTPHVATMTEYRESHRLTAAHIDVLASLSKSREGQEIQHFFPKPLETLPVSSAFEFRLFENMPKIESRTGVYTRHAPDGMLPLIRGRIVVPALSKGKPYLFKSTGLMQGRLGEVVGLLIDRDPSGESESLGFYLVRSDATDSGQAIELGFQKFGKDDLSSFGTIEVGGEEKKDARSQVIVYATTKSKETLLFGLRWDQTDRKGELKLAWSRQLEGEFSQEEIVNRLRVGSESDVYWTINPNFEDGDPRAVLKNLSDNQDVMARGLKLWRVKDKDLMGNSSIVYNTWKLQSGDESERQKLERLRGASEYQLDAFEDYKDILERMADPQMPVRHLIVIVPDELERYAEEYPFALRVREENRPQYWSDRNHRFQVFPIRGAKEVTQDEVMANLEAIRESSRTNRSVIFSTLKGLRAMPRPPVKGSSKEGFFLTLQKIKQVGFQATDEAREMTPPHILYLLATEGREIPLTDFKPKQMAPVVPTLIVGTHRQLQELMQEVEFEDSFGLLKSFEVHYLEPPTMAKRKEFMLRLLRRAELRALNLGVDLDGLLQPGETALDVTAQEAESRFAEYLIHRAETLARINNIGIFEGFMRSMNMLGMDLTTNLQIRKDRMLSKGSAERVLSKVFPMQLNVELLPPDDPLRTLQRRDMPLLVQQAGYYAPLSFIQRGIKTILNQLTPDDIKKRNSLMIFGETGSGKTEFIKTILFKVLKLKRYEFRRNIADNSEAWVFWVDGRKVVEQDRRGSTTPQEKIEIEDSYTAAEIDAHLDRFLLLPNGNRGFIVFDDIHLIPPKARSHFLGRIRMLQDNPMVTIRLGDRRFELPTRNITPIIDFNLIDNQKRLEDFAGKNNPNPTVEDAILATLSNPDGSDDLDKSTLARFGALINLSVGAAQSKAPKLLSTAKGSAQATFSNYRRLVFVAGQSVDEVSEAFPKYDFRTLVSPAAAAMISLPNREGPGIYIVVPRRSVTRDEALKAAGAGGRFTSTGDQDGSDVEIFVSKRLKAIKVDGDVMARIEFLRFLTDNFRRRAFDWLVRGASSDTRFSESTLKQQLLLAPLAHAVKRHLQTYPEASLGEIVVDEVSMGAKTDLERKNFQDAWKRMLETELAPSAPLLSLDSDLVSDGDGLEGLLETPPMSNRNRILVETAHELTEKLGDVLAQSIHISNWKEPPTPLEWVRSVPPSDLSPGHASVRALSDVLHRYFERMMAEASGSDDFINSPSLDAYETMRLFAVAFDRALYRLHWGRVTRFLIDGLQVAVGDLSKGQAPGVQHFLFESRTSPLSPVDLNLVVSNARYQPYVEETEAQELNRHSEFMGKCARLMGRLK